MARARNIKPGFFDDEELAELGAECMVLFAGLWTLADREGRLEDRPKRIKARVLPYFDVDVDALLAGLHARGFIVRYVVGGEAYIQVTNFSKHQTPHIKEGASTIQAPGLHQTSTVQNDENPHETVAPDKHGTNTGLAPPDTGYRIPDSLIADSGFSDSGDAPAALASGTFSQNFEIFWDEWSTGITSGHGGKTPAWRVWKRLKLDAKGASVLRDDVRMGLQRWKASLYWQQEGGRFVMKAERWLGETKWRDSPPMAFGSARASPPGAQPKRYGAYDFVNDIGTENMT